MTQTQPDEYICQKFREAIDALALAEGDLSARLESASLSLLPLTPDDFESPTDKALFEGFWASITNVEDEKLGAIHATTQAMTHEEARAAASTFLELYHRFFPLSYDH